MHSEATKFGIPSEGGHKYLSYQVLHWRLTDKTASRHFPPSAPVSLVSTSIILRGKASRPLMQECSQPRILLSHTPDIDNARPTAAGGCCNPRRAGFGFREPAVDYPPLSPLLLYLRTGRSFALSRLFGRRSPHRCLRSTNEAEPYSHQRNLDGPSDYRNGTLTCPGGGVSSSTIDLPEVVSSMVRKTARIPVRIASRSDLASK